uniref:alpha-2-macroglobulin family protein n=1 Tax=Maribacter thermophilus TaxID=1197874 RepID=UPI0029347E91|nr:MG2 domain-containing protein [Maribacter thermophilus]
MMKNISIILSIVFFSQMTYTQETPESYNELWSKVLKLEKDNYTKSALKVVETIYSKAKKEQHNGQLIKSLLFSSKYALILEEDAELSIINNFNEEISKAKFPVKNILESYLADMYWQYFQQNRYKFYNRTATDTKVDSTDFRTWDLTTLFKEIDTHFKNALDNPEALQKEGLTNFKEIIDQEEGSETYRSTLYDLLAHNALNFYKTDENSITRPADKFEINSRDILCDAYSFTQLDIRTNDETSLQAKALKIYQQLIAFHFSDVQLDALVNVDIERLNYIYSKAVFEDKDTQFLETLKQSADNLKHHEISGLYNFQIAQILKTQGDSYTAENTHNQWKLKEAVTLCDQVISNYPNSRGAKKCEVLKSHILAPSLHIIGEKYVPNNSTSRLLVNYKNRERLDLKVYYISQKQLQELEGIYQPEKELSYIKKLKLNTSWSVSLKNEGDHQQHSIEIPVPKLPNGQYVIIATPQKEATEDADNSFSFSPIQVTNLALVETSTPAEHIFQVIDRENGEEIKNAQITVTYRHNYGDKIRSKTLTTDKNGFALLEREKNTIVIEHSKITYKEETAFFKGTNIYRKQESKTEPSVTYKCFLFKDRSIYRPGQPLYFKGVLIENYKGNSKVAVEELLTVELHDANGQKISELDTKTNDFGSFSGEFIIPNNGLTGGHYIEVTGLSGLINESYFFRVEEYKRPKFETSFEPVTETYKVNDSITVYGKAMAFAGSNITNAKVNYRVQRTINYPYWYYWRKPYFYGEDQEITHGETSTDEHGNFQITFKAIPDLKSDKDALPIFSYHVTADVTDINGETRSTQTQVQVGYHALNATISVNDPLLKENEENIFQVFTQNLNGQAVPAQGNIKIYKLKAPNQVIRPRPWQAPDYQYWSKEDFKALYPHDAYANEHDPNTWEKGKLVYKTSFNTEDSNDINLKSIKKWSSGRYLITLETTDIFGQKVTAKAQTMIMGTKEKSLPDNQLFQVKTDKNTYRPGDNAEITFYSNSKDIHITTWIEKNGKRTNTKILHINEGCESIHVPVTKEDEGGFLVGYSFSIYNSFQSSNVRIAVPYPKSDLEIETVTFRDKMQPGADESWSFKIKGEKGEKVTAELLASMYDASLDQFAFHSWNFAPLSRPHYYSSFHTHANNSFATSRFSDHQDITYRSPSIPTINYDRLAWFGFYFGQRTNTLFGINRTTRKMAQNDIAMNAPKMDIIETEDAALEEVVITGSSVPQPEEATTESSKNTDFNDVQIRENLQETAFFFPHLTTDEQGNVSFNFTTPEALTRWNLQLLAYTKDLKSAIKTLSTVTQKELMVLPNPPRFLREGDTISISSKISNLTDKTLEGVGQLELTDVVTGKTIDHLFLNTDKKQSFKVDAKGNTQLSWSISIPKALQGVEYKIVAKAGNFSDGEKNVLPVLTNRMLVTETLPMWARKDQSKTFVLDKLKNNTSSTLSNHKLSLEITSNPAWYAVQALPYLMEYPYECNEQTFSKYYANTLASHIANTSPKIKAVFDQWANADALVSNLEKNLELKSLLIQETPWLRDAQSESEQKKRIALLFNLNKMRNEQAMALQKLQENQMLSGAWPWFKGGRENRYITQYIVTGFGHLDKLTKLPENIKNSIIKSAIKYLDNEFLKEYEHMKKYSKDLSKDHLSHTQTHYLYMRSFYKDIKTSKKVAEVMEYYKEQARKYWPNRNLYSKGMLALALHRMGDSGTPEKILRSLRENSIVSDELGMYWKENTNSWFWYQAPIETQSLLIEAFSEIENDITTIDNLKIWLLKNKQTNQWKTTKATAEAVYALLLQGSDWLSVTDAVEVQIGEKHIDPADIENIKTEAGTGYYKTSWETNEISPKMATVKIRKKGKGIAWGALYWQYFEDLDKITTAETPLQLDKKLFLKKNTDIGEKITEINTNTHLEVGDLIRVRIELRSDRDMEFVHMKDMRAAGFEPVNVISQYKWQDGLGYYESTKDASTNFFFDYLPKGIYVFEYDLRVNNAGNFSNGITTVQSMYAPEFSSHSEGVRVSVSE